MSTVRHGWRNLFQSGGAQVHVKNKLLQILWFELATVTSQALEYDVIIYISYKGLNYSHLALLMQKHKNS